MCAQDCLTIPDIGYNIACSVFLYTCNFCNKKIQLKLKQEKSMTIRCPRKTRTKNCLYWSKFSVTIVKVKFTM